MTSDGVVAIVVHCAITFGLAITPVYQIKRSAEFPASISPTLSPTNTIFFSLYLLCNNIFI